MNKHYISTAFLTTKICFANEISNKMLVKEISGKRCDIGTPEGWLRANVELLEGYIP